LDELGGSIRMCEFENAMDIERIRDAYHAEPFRRFELVLTSGQRVVVYSPDCMAISPSGRRMVVMGRREGWTTVELDQVASLNSLPDAKSMPA
jgi:hypothetical protein